MDKENKRESQSASVPHSALQPGTRLMGDSGLLLSVPASEGLKAREN